MTCGWNEKDQHVCPLHWKMTGKDPLLSYNTIMTATVYLGKSLAKSIFPMFPQCMKPNALKKSTNNIVFLHEHRQELDG